MTVDAFTGGSLVGQPFGADADREVLARFAKMLVILEQLGPEARARLIPLLQHFQALTPAQQSKFFGGLVRMGLDRESVE